MGRFSLPPHLYAVVPVIVLHALFTCMSPCVEFEAVGHQIVTQKLLSFRYDQVGKDAGVKSISGQRSDSGIAIYTAFPKKVWPVCMAAVE